jgi:membrane protease subunit HflK
MKKRVTSRRVIIAVMATVALLYFLSGVYFIAPDEEALVKRFGRVIHEGIAPGIHYRLPYPIEKEYKFRTKIVYKMSVGYRIIDEINNIPPEEEEMRWLTGDTNVINIRMLAQYTISRPAYYLFSMESPNVYIRNVVESLLTKIAGSTPIDELLTVGKGRLTSTIMEEAQRHLDQFKTGIKIASISIIAIDPPQKVIGAFNDVSDAKLDRERIINESQSYTNDIIPRARGKAQALLQQAMAKKEARILEASGAAERFLSVLEEYKQAQTLTKQRIYLSAMEEILPRVIKYFIDLAPGEKTNLKILQSGNETK